MATIQTKTLTGARAIVQIKGQPVGIFNNIAYSNRTVREPIYTLGSFLPREICAISQDPVAVRLSGYRHIGKTPAQVAGATLIRDLLTEDADGFTVQIIDRRTNTRIAVIEGCKVVDYSIGVSARSYVDLSINLLGRLSYDEASPNGDNDSTPVSF